ncbi:hypothetical protein BOSEA31B_13973 [Hyphomicrobiales bacterium]|nr:hypothetical protein BOSEA31B_13973 [Hyphomicrobiales bacterium]CAH1699749.1 hypothetical protein BOSEA1005_12802 [Hyphomicrobiales bacterium]CAI0343480.1 hypothetical protein BO1005MUT1_270089 [Hyphomicrobiales bacterium]
MDSPAEGLSRPAESAELRAVLGASQRLRYRRWKELIRRAALVRSGGWNALPGAFPRCVAFLRLSSRRVPLLERAGAPAPEGGPRA